jgi:outer membrane lipoprotein SlyB
MTALSVATNSAGAQRLSPVAVDSRFVAAHSQAPRLVHADANAPLTVLTSDRDSHADVWGAIIGGVAGGAIGYAYERGSCDQLARLCTGRHGAVAGVILGAALGYGVGRILRH